MLTTPAACLCSLPCCLQAWLRSWGWYLMAEPEAMQTRLSYLERFLAKVPPCSQPETS